MVLVHLKWPLMSPRQKKKSTSPLAALERPAERVRDRRARNTGKRLSTSGDTQPSLSWKEARFCQVCPPRVVVRNTPCATPFERCKSCSCFGAKSRSRRKTFFETRGPDSRLAAALSSANPLRGETAMRTKQKRVGVESECCPGNELVCNMRCVRRIINIESPQLANFVDVLERDTR